jgi:lysophospholipase L1-like esterase
VLALILAEVLLRVIGRGPYVKRGDARDLPLMHVPDAELGWKNKPGEYNFGIIEPIRMTFWPDGTRATAPRPVEADVRLALIGDSFTEGWAVTDTQTFGWKLQERFPKVSVRNYGSSGYGTVQSLLALKALLEGPGPHPNVVMYGFNDFHEDRNVAKATWLRDVFQVEHRGHVALPYAELAEGGTLLFQAPTSYPSWPLHDRSAIVATVERSWAELSARGRSAHARAVTDALLLEIDRVVRSHRGRFLVVVLAQWMPDSVPHYLDLLARHRIAAANCHHPAFLGPMGQVPYYGHPNAAVNALWGACMEAALLGMGPEVAREFAP